MRTTGGQWYVCTLNEDYIYKDFSCSSKWFVLGFGALPYKELKWNTFLLEWAFCVFYRETEACRANKKWDGEEQKRYSLSFRAVWNKTHDVPLKPTSGVYKYTCFSPSCFFTSDSFCSMLSAWSCLVWPSVLLSCFSGKGLAWHFHALFSVARFASEHGGVLFFFLICFLLFSSLFIYLLTYSQITLSCSLFYLPRLPSSLNSLSCCLYNYSFSSIRRFCVPLTLFPEASFVCSAWCPAICAGWHEWLKKHLRQTSFNIHRRMSEVW